MESYLPVYMFIYNVIFHMLLTLLIISSSYFYVIYIFPSVFEYA
jgi:hypothetical protein